MKKVKGIIAIDLDGTLLDANGHYSDATRDYLRSLSAQGYLIVLATGRPYRAVKPFYEDLQLDSPVICYNGGLVFHPKDRSYNPMAATFSASDIRQIYEATHDFVDHYMAESAKKIYLDKRDERLDRYFPYAGMELIEGPLSDLDEDVFTCLFQCKEEDMDRLMFIIEDINPTIGWQSWTNGGYSELYDIHADKGIGLYDIQLAYGVKREDIYAFGDAGNDLSLLLQAGHPFAMKGRRNPQTLSIFPETENPVDEDGVIKTLQKVLP